MLVIFLVLEQHMYALSMTVNPEKQASSAIEKLLRYPGFLKHDTFAKGARRYS